MPDKFPRLVDAGDTSAPASIPPPPPDDAREVFRLQVLEDLEEEKTLLYRFICVGESITLALLVRSLLLDLL